MGFLKSRVDCISQVEVNFQIHSFTLELPFCKPVKKSGNFTTISTYTCKLQAVGIIKPQLYFCVIPSHKGVSIPLAYSPATLTEN